MKTQMMAVRCHHGNLAIRRPSINLLLAPLLLLLLYYVPIHADATTTGPDGTAAPPSSSRRAAARRLIYRKGTDSHDYKFSSAALEDYSHVSPQWRDRFLAASVFWFKGSTAADSGLVRRTRAALGIAG